MDTKKRKDAASFLEMSREHRLINKYTRVAAFDKAPPVSLVKSSRGYKARFTIPSYDIYFSEEGEALNSKKGIAADIVEKYRKKYPDLEVIPSKGIEYEVTLDFETIKDHLVNLYVAFRNETERTYFLTDTGGSLSVFAGVIEALRSVLEKVHVDIIHFTADTPNRQKLYATLARRFLPNFDVHQNGGSFYLARKDLILQPKNKPLDRGLIERAYFFNGYVFLDPQSITVIEGATAEEEFDGVPNSSPARIRGKLFSEADHRYGREGIPIPLNQLEIVSPHGLVVDITWWATTKEGAQQLSMIQVDQARNKGYIPHSVVRQEPSQNLGVLASQLNSAIGSYFDLHARAVEAEPEPDEPSEPSEPDTELDRDTTESLQELTYYLETTLNSNADWIGLNLGSDGWLESINTIVEGEDLDAINKLAELARVCRQSVDDSLGYSFKNRVFRDYDAPSEVLDFINATDDEDILGTFADYVEYMLKIKPEVDSMMDDWSNYDYAMETYQEELSRYEEYLENEREAEDHDRETQSYYEALLGYLEDGDEEGAAIAWEDFKRSLNYLDVDDFLPNHLVEALDSLTR